MVTESVCQWCKGDKAPAGFGFASRSGDGCGQVPVFKCMNPACVEFEQVRRRQNSASRMLGKAVAYHKAAEAVATLALAREKPSMDEVRRVSNDLFWEARRWDYLSKRFEPQDLLQAQGLEHFVGDDLFPEYLESLSDTDREVMRKAGKLAEVLMHVGWSAGRAIEARRQSLSESELELTAEEMAKDFHELYEGLAPSFKYETRKASAVPWSQVPSANRELMIAVCRRIVAQWVCPERKLSDG